MFYFLPAGVYSLQLRVFTFWLMLTSPFHDFTGLEMQTPFAGHILDGRKTIETRRYDLPAGLVGRRVEILETAKGVDGVSGLEGSEWNGKEIKDKVIWKGWVTFSKVVKYEREEDFVRDNEKHMVDGSSGYAWKRGETKCIFGWVVEKVGKYVEKEGRPLEGFKVRRRFRSLFEMTSTGESDSRVSSRNNKKKNKGKKNKNKNKSSDMPASGGSELNKNRKKRRF